MTAQALSAPGPGTLPFTLDASDPAFYAQDNHADAFNWIHANAPIYYCDAAYSEPFWNVCDDAEIKLVGRDPEKFTSKDGIWLGNRFTTEREGSPLPDDPRFPLQGAHTIEPTEHRRQRKPINSMMIARDAAQSWDARIRAVVTQAVNELEPGVATNFMDFAHRIPILVTTSLFGIDTDRESDFALWANTVVQALDPGPEMDWSPLIEMLDFMDEQIAYRRRHPGDDVISGLLGGLTDEQVRSWLWLLFVGGIETTGNLLTGGLHLLLTHPDQKQRVVDDPKLLPAATAEMLRMICPSRYTKRNATRDCEIAGHQIASGDAVVMNFIVANHDPKLYPEPFRFDVTRQPPPMLAFGNGQHVCPGNSIARLEIVIAFEELLRHFPNIELAGDLVVAPTLSTVHIEQLPVVYRG